MQFWQNTRFCSTPPVTRGSGRRVVPWKLSCFPLNTGECVCVCVWPQQRDGISCDFPVTSCLVSRLRRLVFRLVINFVYHCVQRGRCNKRIRLPFDITTCVFNLKTFHFKNSQKHLPLSRWWVYFRFRTNAACETNVWGSLKVNFLPCVKVWETTNIIVVP